MKNAGLSVSLPVFLLAIVICQMSEPSNDLPTEYTSTRSGYLAAHARISASDSSGVW
jgi:hypothetical protein